MAKRFTETGKWNDPWFRRLSPSAKLLWFWLTDNCDAAGIIDPDFGLASFQIGMEVDEQTMADFGNRVARLECGKWIVAGFIVFQVGEPSRDCKAHKPIFQSLEKHRVERVSKGYPIPLDTVQEKDKDKDTDKDGLRGCGREGVSTTLLPPGFPTTYEAALGMCLTACPEAHGEFVRDVWETLRDVGGKDGSGRQVLQFGGYVGRRWRNEHLEWQAKRNGQHHGNKSRSQAPQRRDNAVLNLPGRYE